MAKKKYIAEENWQRPRTFEEYYARYPDWHEMWLGSRYPVWSNSDFADVAQTLLLRSIETQRVEKYDPAKGGYNDTPGLFFHWLGLCYRRDLATVLSERKRNNRAANYHTFSVDGISNPDLLMQAGSKKLGITGSEQYRQGTEQEAERAFNHIRLEEFRAYVAECRPDLVPLIDLMDCGRAEITDWNKRILRDLAKKFEGGVSARIVKKRKPYNSKRRRAAEANARWRAKHTEYMQRYRREHREKIRAYEKERRAALKAAHE